MPSFPTKHIVTGAHHYSIWEKSSRRDEVSAHTVTFLKIVSQNALDFIAAHILFKTFPGGMPPDPLRGLWPLRTSPLNDKSYIEPWFNALPISAYEIEPSST